jgi:D-serine deaminase-like pyridoxal phosphate-dependent protein
MKLQDIETPALILDYDKFKSNVNKIMEMIEDHPIKLRPHFKTHKSTVISKKLIASGAKGICCSKLGEAQVLADAGIEDILIANQVTQLSKVDRIAELAGKCRLSICVDNKENIDALSSACKKAQTTLYVLVELDVGMNRCGVKTNEEFHDLAQYVIDSDQLVFEGIQAYGGHNALQADDAIRLKACHATLVRVANLRDYLLNNGITCNEISGGSTGTSYLKAGAGVYTELQAGSFVYMDSLYAKASNNFENSLALLATVISKTDDYFITDAGLKSCTVEFGDPLPIDYPDVKPRLSEEHISLDVKDHGMKLNDMVRFKPSHCCTTMNIHDILYIIQDGEVLEVAKIDGRGKSV